MRRLLRRLSDAAVQSGGRRGAGKRVVLVGDRADAEAVALLRACGAREVHLRVYVPVCSESCRYGGAPRPDSGDGGADTVGYLSARQIHLLADGLCTACMERA